MDAVSCTITNPNDQNAPPKKFTFDASYFTNSTTEQIYNDIGFPLVEVRTCLMFVVGDIAAQVDL